MNKTYFYIFMVATCLVGVWILSPYFSLIFFSFIVVNFFYPIFLAIEKRVKNEHFATLITLIVIFVLCLIPLVFVINVTTGQASVFYRDLNAFLGNHDLPHAVEPTIAKVNEFLARIPGNDFRITPDAIKSIVSENLRPLASYVLDFSLNLSATLIKTIPLVIIFAFVLWSSFADYRKFIEFLKKISPLSDVLDELYLHRITAMTNAMVRGTFFIAIVQGSVAALILWVLGVPYVFFWWILMIFLSIVPLGAGFATYPIGIIQILLGNYVVGIAIILLQTFFIGHIDNLMRPYLVPKEADVHPIVLLLSILGGLQLFGVLGFIYGPIIMIILKTTVEIYLKYYSIKATPLRGKKTVKTKT